MYHLSSGYKPQDKQIRDLLSCGRGQQTISFSTRPRFGRKQSKPFSIRRGQISLQFKYNKGWQQSFHTIWMWICGLLAHVNKNCRKLQILIGIITTFSEKIFQNKQVWPQLQPKTWSEAILRIYKSVHHFIIDSLQKCILEAVIDCLEIQSWLKGEIVPKWMSSLSKAAFKMHVWRLSMIEMVQTFEHSENTF